VSHLDRRFAALVAVVWAYYAVILGFMLHTI
jgi:hypothetical protein